MELSEFLEASGWTKAQVSRHVGVSKAAVGQWVSIPGRYLEELREVLVNDVAPSDPVKGVDLSDIELLGVIRGRSEESDWVICRRYGWRIWEFNQKIADLVKKYPISDPFWNKV